MFSHAPPHLTVKQPFEVKIIIPFFPGAEAVVPKPEVSFPKQYKANHAMRVDFKHWSGWPQIQPSISPTRWTSDNHASDLRPLSWGNFLVVPCLVQKWISPRPSLTSLLSPLGTQSWSYPPAVFLHLHPFSPYFI